MHIVSTFEHSLSLEYALSGIEEIGITRDCIWTIPLESQLPHANILDTTHGADGISVINAAAVFGTILGVLGASFGFALYLGPIIWGLIGFGTGALIGFTSQYYIKKRKQKKAGQLSFYYSEVVVIIDCQQDHNIERVVSILKEAKANGIGTL